jgi:hypothetical protein
VSRIVQGGFNPLETGVGDVVVDVVVSCGIGRVVVGASVVVVVGAVVVAGGAVVDAEVVVVGSALVEDGVATDSPSSPQAATVTIANTIAAAPRAVRIASVSLSAARGRRHPRLTPTSSPIAYVTPQAMTTIATWRPIA